MNRIQSASMLLAGVSALALPALAIAQTPPPAANDTSEVVVTGSRVIKNGNNSPTPVTVVPIDDAMTVHPTTVADALNDMPQFSGSRMQSSNTNAGVSIQTGGGNSVGNYLNLRNMGQARTLILFDGQRVPPTAVDGLIDVDMIPQSLLQRVDVVTGGASAVYGSDAVAGVVNFITDKNFNGLKLNVQAGVTQLGDDRSVKFGIAAGRTLFGGKGHIEFSYDYYDDNGIPYRNGGARDPNSTTPSFEGNGTAAVPYVMVLDPRIPTATFGGLVVSTTGPLAGMTFQQNGVLSPFVHGTPTIPGTTGSNEIGGEGYYDDTAMKSVQLSHQAFARLDYDFSETMHGDVSVALNSKLNPEYNTWQSLNKATISSTDAFLPAAYQSQLAAAKQTSFQLSKELMDAPRTEPVSLEQQIFVNAQLAGQFNANYKWNIGFVHSTARLTDYNTNSFNNGRLYASLDAVKDPASGNIVCNVTLTNPTLYPGCVPLNPFGPTSDSPAAINWIAGVTSLVNTTQLDDVSGGINGAPFSIWAGPVNMAVSGDYRRLSSGLVSTAVPGVFLNCTGLRYNCTATSTAQNNTTANRPTVTETVGEGAFEVDAPLLKDLPFIQSFDLNGAVRYTAYSISGNYVTWKVGVDWHATDDIRFRGTRSHDIRAPTLDDLFAPNSQSIGVNPIVDPLTLQNVTGVTTVSGGNPNLTAEVGDTWTGGMVLRPHWVPGFTLSVDYFNSTVSNAIFAVVPTNATIERACVASGGSSPYCQIFVRPLPYSNTTAANNFTTLYSDSINIASQFTQGVDFEANYVTKVFGRAASARWLATYQPEIDYIQPQTVTINQAGAAFGNNSTQAAPVWRFTAFLRYTPFDNFTIDTETRWRTGLRPAGDPTLVFAGGSIPPASYTNLTLTYRINSSVGQTDLYLNVQDLFNLFPPYISSFTNLTPGLQANYSAFDGDIGRAFNVGIRFKH